MQFEQFLSKVIEDLAKIAAENKIRSLKSSPESGWKSWPAEAWHIEYFGATEQRKIFFEYLKELIVKGKTPEEIGRLFVIPSRLLYLGILPGRKQQSCLSLKERKEFSEITYNIYKTMKKPPFYNKQGQHLILSEEKLERLNQKEPTLTGSECPQFAKSLHIDLFGIVENLYGYRRTNGCEVHGIYHIKEGDFICRDIIDINSPFLSSTNKVNFSHMQLIEKIDNLEVSIDNFQHINCQGNWPNSIKEIYCILDGKLIKKEKFTSLCSEITETLKNSTEEITKLDYKKKIELMLKNYFFALRRIPISLNKEIYPKEFFKNLSSKEIPIDTNPAKNLENDTFEEIYRKMFNKFNPLI